MRIAGVISLIDHVAPRTRRGWSTLPLAVGLLATAAVLIGGVELALLYSGVVTPPPWPAALFPVAGWVYVAAGLTAWLRRPGNRIGAVMVVGGFAWFVAGLANTSVPALIAAGLITATLPLAVPVHLLHAFPSGTLRTALSRGTVAAAYVVALLGDTPKYLLAPSPLAIAARPDLVNIAHWVQHGIGAVVMLVTAVVLGARLRTATPSQRRWLAPLYLYGILAVLWVPASRDLQVLFPGGLITRVAAQILVLSGIPVAFLVGLLRGGFAPTGAVEELGARLGAFELARPALADALGDPSLELLFWAPDIGGYVDAAGRQANIPASGSDRGAVEVMLADRRVGAIVYDATLIADPELVRAAGRVVALALDRERLTAELRASRERLRQSRARVVESGERERRRIARDLHDGLQTRLVLLATDAHRLQADTSGSSATRTTAAGLEAGLRTAIRELRGLVHGVMPAALAEQGLCAAAEELAHRMPIPVALALDLDGGSLPAPVESAGYFVISEALANAIKHSRAHELSVGIERDHEWVRIEVGDDGIGGAAANAGGGLRGIADRVEALEGRLTIDSQPGAGTRVITELPCAS